MIKRTIKLIAGNLGLYFLAIIFPILAYIMPFYTLKNTKDNNVFFTVELATLVFLTTLRDFGLILIYVMFFLVVKIIYYYLKKMEAFNKILLSSVITLIIGLVVYYINKEFFIKLLTEFEISYKEIVKKARPENVELAEKYINFSMSFVRTYAMAIVFTIALYINYFSYCLLENNKVKKWKLSYLYIIIYAIMFVVVKIFKIENNILINIFWISKIPYILYGLKAFYFGMEKNIKSKILRLVLLNLIISPFYEFIFIIGGLSSFEITKYIKKNTD